MEITRMTNDRGGKITASFEQSLIDELVLIRMNLQRLTSPTPGNPINMLGKVLADAIEKKNP